MQNENNMTAAKRGASIYLMQVLILRMNILPSGRESGELQRVSEFIHHHFTRIIELRNAKAVAPGAAGGETVEQGYPTFTLTIFTQNNPFSHRRIMLAIVMTALLFNKLVFFSTFK